MKTDKQSSCNQGHCESDGFGSCVNCGALMFMEGGRWWHWSQESIPIDERIMIHF